MDDDMKETKLFMFTMDNEDDTLIAKNMFDFYDLGDLNELANKNVYLTDVIRVIYKDSPIRKLTSKFNEPQVQVKFTIVNGRTSVDVTFWGSGAEEFATAFEQVTEYPAIIIITSAKITFWQGTNHTTPQLDIANTTATKFYLNYDHHSVAQLRKMLGTTLFSKYDFSSQIPDTIETLNIEQIHKLGKEYIEKEIVSYVKVTNVEDHQKWYYSECTSCYKEIEIRDGLLACYRCSNQEVTQPLKKFQVYITADDGTGEIDICLFDRAIKTLIGKDVDDIEEEGANEEDLPLMLKTIEKKWLTVKLLITSNNVEKKSKFYQGIDVATVQTDLQEEHNDNMKILVTQASTSTYHLDDFSQLNFETSEINKKKRGIKKTKKAMS